jgi:hypothetical protein
MRSSLPVLSQESAAPARPSSAPIRCLRDVVDLPPSAFALDDDGRQARHLCDRRKALAVIMARYANADGGGAYPAAKTLAKAMGRGRATVFRLLGDLRTLGFMSDGQLAWFRGPRKRTLHVAKMKAAGVSSSPESHLRDPGVSSSPPESHLRGSTCVCREDETQPPDGNTEPRERSEPPKKPSLTLADQEGGIDVDAFVQSLLARRR